MKSLKIINLIILATLFLSVSSFASLPNIECTTTRMTGKKVIISQSKVTYVEEYMGNEGPKREIASLETSITNVRTMYSASGITKMLSFEGHQHTIHIENVASPSDMDDYLSIKSPRGHEITYPLTCKTIK